MLAQEMFNILYSSARSRDLPGTGAILLSEVASALLRTHYTTDMSKWLRLPEKNYCLLSFQSIYRPQSRHLSPAGLEGEAPCEPVWRAKLRLSRSGGRSSV